MKVDIRVVIFVILFLIKSVNYSVVGTNNVTIGVGGNFNYTKLSRNKNQKDLYEEFIGGGFSISLGHLYLSEDLSQGSLIHGMDTKLTFAMNFSPIAKQGGKKVELIEGHSFGFNDITVSLGTTYMIGTKVDKGRLMVDIVGLNLGYLTGATKLFLNPTTIIHKTGNNFLLGIDLPLGIRYIFDNGFSIGFSHRLDFAFGKDRTGNTISESGNTTTSTPNNGSSLGTKENQASYLAYNLSLDIAFVFGK